MSAAQPFSETLSLSATGNTTPRFVSGFNTVSFFVNSTGTANGTWEVDCSNDGVTWTAYTLATTPPAASGSPQTFGVAIVFYEYAYVRLKFNNSSSTGSATVTTLLKNG